MIPFHRKATKVPPPAQKYNHLELASEWKELIKPKRHRELMILSSGCGPDEELPEITRAILAGELRDRNEIKLRT